jgi:hypothetical protein
VGRQKKENVKMFLSSLLSFAADTLLAFLRSKLAVGQFIDDILNPESRLPVLHKTKQDGEIWRFLSHFKKGFAKSTRYRIEFSLPRGASGRTINAVNDVNQFSRAGQIKVAEKLYNRNGSINIKAHTVTFPQRSLSTFEIKHNSAPFKIPYTSTYDPVTISFYNDQDMDVRRYFDIWQGTIMNFSNNTTNFYNEYVSDIKMFIQNDAGEDVYGILLVEAFPLGISIMDMAYSSTNQMLPCSVTFSYKYWLPFDSSQRVSRSA